jgi:hypothetical protein
MTSLSSLSVHKLLNRLDVVFFHKDVNLKLKIVRMPDSESEKCITRINSVTPVEISESKYPLIKLITLFGKPLEIGLFGLIREYILNAPVNFNSKC